MKRFILKKRSKTFHIVATLFTYGIWAIVYFATKYSTERQDNKPLKKENIITTNNETKVEQINDLKPKFNIYQFNVAGTSFDDEETGKNRQKTIQNIAKEGIELGYLIPYNDTSNKDMLELYIDEEFWVAGQYIKRTKLEITEYNNEPAIKVYISDYKDVYYHIGYVPKVEINKVLEILNSNPKEIYSEFSGGKFKEIYFDDEVLKDKVRVNDSLSYGIKVTIKY